jgi:hypothetical protein
MLDEAESLNLTESDHSLNQYWINNISLKEKHHRNAESRKLIFTRIIVSPILITFFVLLASFFLVAGESPEILNVSTGDIPVGIATIKLEYNVQVNVNNPSKATKGSTTDWTINIYDGRVTLYLKVADLTFSKSVDVPPGQRVEVNLAPGVIAYLYTKILTDVIVDGNAVPDKNNLLIDREGSISFHVKILKNAKTGDVIKVSLPMRLSVRGGLKIDLGPISENIVDIELGEFPLNPVIEKTIEVTEQPPILPGVTISISSTIFLVIAIVMIIFFFALIYYFRRRILSS